MTQTLPLLHQHRLRVVLAGFTIFAPNFVSFNMCHVQPSEGLVLRRMFLIDDNRKRQYFPDPPRMNRKDNLFR